MYRSPSHDVVDCRDEGAPEEVVGSGHLQMFVLYCFIIVTFVVRLG